MDHRHSATWYFTTLLLLDFLDQNCNSQTAVTDHCGLSSTLLTAENTEINCFSIQGAKSPVVKRRQQLHTWRAEETQQHLRGAPDSECPFDTGVGALYRACWRWFLQGRWHQSKSWRVGWVLPFKCGVKGYMVCVSGGMNTPLKTCSLKEQPPSRLCLLRIWSQGFPKEDAWKKK